MISHPSPNELEQYIIGALDRKDALPIEHHVAGCETCAIALTREAQLEMKLQEVAVSRPSVRREHSRARGMAVVGGLAVMACVVALLVLDPFRAKPPVVEPEGDSIARPTRREKPVPPIEIDTPTYSSGVSCTASLDTAQCIRDAHLHGRVVIAPTIQVPRYEHAAADQTR